MTGIPVAVGELVGTDYLNEVARAHWRKATAQTVAGTITETDLLNGEFTIAAGAVDATHGLLLLACGIWKQNSGGPLGPPLFRLKLGGTTLLDTNASAATVLNDVGSYLWEVAAFIQNQNATNSQFVKMSGEIYHAGVAAATFAAFTTGTGTYRGFIVTGDALEPLRFNGYNTAAIDMTAARLLELKVINPSNNANYSITLNHARAILL